jgi:hypothetical protein
MKRVKREGGWLWLSGSCEKSRDIQAKKAEVRLKRAVFV